jgi:hypothetical protein
MVIFVANVDISQIFVQYYQDTQCVLFLSHLRNIPILSHFVGEELLRSRLERSVCRLHSRMSGKHKAACSLSLLSHFSLSSIDVTMMPFAATLLQHTKSHSAGTRVIPFANQSHHNSPF